MPSAKEEERAVFEDDDEDTDTDGDDSDDGEDDDYVAVDAELVGIAPPPPPAEKLTVSMTTAYPNPSALPNPSPNPKPSPPSDAAPQNGSISAVSLTDVAVGSSARAPTPRGALVVVSASDNRRTLASSAFDESRRLFQRLWTDEEELIILRGFLDFTTRRGTTFASHQYDTGPFYGEIKKQLHFEFSKNQLVEKLRRLKKKFRNCANRIQTVGKDFAFKSTHEQAIFEIARNIWRPGIKRDRDSDDDDFIPPNHAPSNDAIALDDGSMGSEGRMPRSRCRVRRRTTEDSEAAAAVGAAGAETALPVMVTVENSIPPPTHQPVSAAPSAAIPRIIEETVRSCLFPLLKELISSAMGGGHLGLGLDGWAGFPETGIPVPSLLNPLLLKLDTHSVDSSRAPVGQKWKQQQILELEVYSKRMELIHDQIKSRLEELKSSGR